MIDAPDRHDSFAMFHVLEARQCLFLLKQRELKPRDFSVLFMLMSHCNSRNGKIRVKLSELADQTNTRATDIASSISRLKKNKIIATMTDEMNDRYYAINPYLMSVGRRQFWAMQAKRFLAEFETQQEGDS